MNAVLSGDLQIPEIQSQAREMTRRQVEEWFGWIDRILEIHRSNFVFRNATPKELEEHQQVMKLSIRCSHLVNALIGDPDFNAPDLVARLQVRIRKLQDAYDTFHDATLSRDEAEKILKQVFPE